MYCFLMFAYLVNAVGVVDVKLDVFTECRLVGVVDDDLADGAVNELGRCS